MIKLVVFLGNYGNEYAQNRHNAAWLLCDFVLRAKNVTWQKKFLGDYAVFSKTSPFSAELEKCYFVKPETYMNRCGNCAAPFANFFKIKPDEMLIVHDEIELPLGTISLKWSGGLGGHNGLRSLKEQFGTADFWRLRIGIGRPNAKTGTEHMDVASFVLSNFTVEEKIVLEQTFTHTVDFFDTLILNDANIFLKEWAKKKTVS